MRGGGGIKVVFVVGGGVVVAIKSTNFGKANFSN